MLQCFWKETRETDRARRTFAVAAAATDAAGAATDAKGWLLLLLQKQVCACTAGEAAAAADSEIPLRHIAAKATARFVAKRNGTARAEQQQQQLEMRSDTQTATVRRARKKGFLLMERGSAVVMPCRRCSTCMQ